MAGPFPGSSGAGIAEAKLKQLALTLPFIAFFLVQLAHHDMWRDEINAFGIALASPTLSTLFHYVHYEGHPWLWYVLLWVVSKITVLPVGMKCLQALIGTGIYLMIGVASPFRTWEKLLLFTCYFISFEYSVMTRMYGLLVLLALVYIRRRAQTPGRVYGNAALLGLMACTDLTGMVVSFALAVEYAIAAYQEWRTGVSFSAPQNGARARLLPSGHRAATLAGALLIYAVLGLSAVATLIPAKDISTSSTSGLMTYAFSGKQLARVIVSYVVKPYFPTATGKAGHYWGPAAASHMALFVACIPLVLAAYWYTLRRRASTVALLAVTSLLMMCIGQFIYYGSIRHFGMTFLAFFLSLWLLRSAGDGVHWPAWVLVGMTALGGIQMAWGAWQRPFSQEGPAARYIVAHHLQDGPMVAHLGMGAWMDRAVYMPECHCAAKFLLFQRGSDYHGFKVDQMIDAERFAGGVPYTYMGLEPLSSQDMLQMRQRGLVARPLVALNGSEVDFEDVYLYSVFPQAWP